MIFSVQMIKNYTLFLLLENYIILKELIYQYKFNKFFQRDILEILLILGNIHQIKNNFHNILSFCKIIIIILMFKTAAAPIVLIYKSNQINLYFIIKKKELPKLKKANILNLI